MNAQVYLGICYFPTYKDAEIVAKGLGLTLQSNYRQWPTAHHFSRGWAIQTRCSGPYVIHKSSGPALPPQN